MTSALNIIIYYYLYLNERWCITINALELCFHWQAEPSLCVCSDPMHALHVFSVTALRWVLAVVANPALCPVPLQSPHQRVRCVPRGQDPELLWVPAGGHGSVRPPGGPPQERGRAPRRPAVAALWQTAAGKHWEKRLKVVSALLGYVTSVGVWSQIPNQQSQLPPPFCISCVQ